MESKETEEIKDKKEEVKRIKSIEAVAESEGGKLLIEEIKNKIAFNVDTLVNSFLTMPEAQMRAVCANIYSLLEVLRTLNRAEKDATIAVTELEKLLEENKE
ncbi:MAG: hypothetical protein JSS91_00810 [Bacteroidetes bacterium]|nr:hypothetical protein [Bacteroidota bacterium]